MTTMEQNLDLEDIEEETEESEPIDIIHGPAHEFAARYIASVEPEFADYLQQSISRRNVADWADCFNAYDRIVSERKQPVPPPPIRYDLTAHRDSIERKTPKRTVWGKMQQILPVGEPLTVNQIIEMLNMPKVTKNYSLVYSAIAVHHNEFEVVETGDQYRSKIYTLKTLDNV